MSTAGPNSPSSASGWTNSTNVYSSDNNYATDLVPSLSSGSYLYVKGFGFAIDSGSTMNGVTVVIERKGQVANKVRDSDLYLLNSSGAATGDSRNSLTYWPTTDGTATYGGASDMWGTTLTASNINSANFGIRLAAANSDSVDRTAYVDYVSITIDYTLPSGQPMQARSRLVPYTRRAQKIGW